MLSLRQIRRRIKSVENTKKITRAMEMVAASKLKKLQDLLKQSDRYIGELGRILGTLVREKPLAHPLLERREEIKNVLAFLIASDAGLCGSYNTNLFDQTNRFTSAVPGPARFVAIGKQSAAFLKRNRLSVIDELHIPRPQEMDGLIEAVTKIAVDEFQSKRTDQVIFIYTKVVSLGSLKPATEQLFPFASGTSLRSSKPSKAEAIPTEIASSGPSVGRPRLPAGKAGNDESVIDYIIEPSLEDILEIVIPEFIQAQIGQFVKHSLVAEQASRMMAMRQATDNASEMIDSLTLARNKARQASITKELLEVVSGSRALHMK